MQRGDAVRSLTTAQHLPHFIQLTHCFCPRSGPEKNVARRRSGAEADFYSSSRSLAFISSISACWFANIRLHKFLIWTSWMGISDWWADLAAWQTFDYNHSGPYIPGVGYISPTASADSIVNTLLQHDASTDNGWLDFGLFDGFRVFMNNLGEDLFKYNAQVF